MVPEPEVSNRLNAAAALSSAEPAQSRTRPELSSTKSTKPSSFTSSTSNRRVDTSMTCARWEGVLAKPAAAASASHTATKARRCSSPSSLVASANRSNASGAPMRSSPVTRAASCSVHACGALSMPADSSACAAASPAVEASRSNHCRNSSRLSRPSLSRSASLKQSCAVACASCSAEAPMRAAAAGSASNMTRNTEVRYCTISVKSTKPSPLASNSANAERSLSSWEPPQRMVSPAASSRKSSVPLPSWSKAWNRRSNSSLSSRRSGAGSELASEPPTRCASSSTRRMAARNPSRDTTSSSSATSANRSSMSDGDRCASRVSRRTRATASHDGCADRTAVSSVWSAGVELRYQRANSCHDSWPSPFRSASCRHCAAVLAARRSGDTPMERAASSSAAYMAR
mmetsp:Transcript_4111/g.13234  ORF Transcript_4111/g.13234 Transcript_4111/m.13234 type:complete len:402 (-) Transcript_4111:406-1611(-)